MIILFLIKKLFVMFVLFVLLIFINQSRAQAIVYVTPVSTVLSGQNTFSVDIMVSNVSELHAYSVKILFENSVISFQSKTKGPFLSTGGNSTVFYSNPSTVFDSINVEEAILGASIVSGSGKLFSLSYNIISAGISAINIIDVQLLKIDNEAIPVTWNSGEVIVPLSVNLRAFLQGPFNLVSMNTTLNSSGYLPLVQPYSGNPWNYTGTELVPLGFFSNHPNIVDWILVELRSGTNANMVIAKKVGFLLNTGNVVGLDGNSTLYFMEQQDNYYTVIYHRNHLAIMSSTPINLDYVSILYDYTTDLSKAFGTNAMINLGDNIFGMYAADANGNGQIQNNDSESFWTPQNGQSGYKSADFNLNGQVQNNDRESYWVPNNGKGTQVPD